MTANISYAEFKACEGQTFQIDALPQPLKLAEVSARAVTGSWESFSLLFELAEGQSLEQGSYLLRRGDLAWDLFLVPVGVQTSTPGVSCYESVFNRAV